MQIHIVRHCGVKHRSIQNPGIHVNQLYYPLKFVVIKKHWNTVVLILCINNTKLYQFDCKLNNFSIVPIIVVFQINFKTNLKWTK